MPKIEFVETDELPICPYCEQELSSIKVVERMPFFSFHEQHVCFCPHCRKVLPVSVNRTS